MAELRSVFGLPYIGSSLGAPKPPRSVMTGEPDPPSFAPPVATKPTKSFVPTSQPTTPIGHVYNALDEFFPKAKPGMPQPLPVSGSALLRFGKGAARAGYGFVADVADKVLDTPIAAPARMAGLTSPHFFREDTDQALAQTNLASEHTYADTVGETLGPLAFGGPAAWRGLKGAARPPTVTTGYSTKDGVPLQIRRDPWKNSYGNGATYMAELPRTNENPFSPTTVGILQVRNKGQAISRGQGDYMPQYATNVQVVPEWKTQFDPVTGEGIGSKGVGSAMYNEAERWRNIVPSEQLTNQGQAFWMKRDPERVRAMIRNQLDETIRNARDGSIKPDYLHSQLEFIEEYYNKTPGIAKLAKEEAERARGILTEEGRLIEPTDYDTPPGMRNKGAPPPDSFFADFAKDHPDNPISDIIREMGVDKPKPSPTPEGFTEVPPAYTPPSPQTLQDYINSLREAAGQPPIPTGPPAIPFIPPKEIKYYFNKGLQPPVYNPAVDPTPPLSPPQAFQANKGWNMQPIEQPTNQFLGTDEHKFQQIFQWPDAVGDRPMTQADVPTNYQDLMHGEKRLHPIVEETRNAQRTYLNSDILRREGAFYRALDHPNTLTRYNMGMPDPGVALPYEFTRTQQLQNLIADYPRYSVNNPVEVEIARRQLHDRGLLRPGQEPPPAGSLPEDSYIPPTLDVPHQINMAEAAKMGYTKAEIHAMIEYVNRPHTYTDSETRASIQKKLYQLGYKDPANIKAYDALIQHLTGGGSQ